MTHNNTSPIRIKITDKERLISDFREDYLKLHPELEGIRISMQFLFTKLLDYALDEGEFRKWNLKQKYILNLVMNI